ncbi:Site-specific DNA methylase [Moraxella equi]|uniref:site-specific DNA-methyltransferase (adenine-specific) n=1 Tax=Moraxella equi TaxID=60442 RepID=A0A378QPM9_9GAMM|nr:hypothetical protein B5J93_11390 [Moraxella equi]STZ02836.1 Site-specific DNA methylase [Moraxella equi]
MEKLVAKSNQHNKPHSTAPLPFIGQKRQIIQVFRNTLDRIVPDDGQGWTIIDVFGGSGLLAHNAKYLKPKARVIYNDFDNFSQRLYHLCDTNRLRQQLYAILEPLPRAKRIDEPTKQKLLEIIQNFDGFVDCHSVSTWLLFSGNQISHIDELPKHEFYNTIRRSDYPTADGYLDGLEIVSENFEILMPKFYHQDKTLFILDPPYLRTKQEAYGLGEYFGMVQFLKLMKWVRPPYLFFSSTKSEFLSYLDYVKTHEPETWKRVGDFEKLSFTAHVNNSSKYEDNMVFKI